jgi:2-amino-4-hydroxy-6-hydroxymethyldihydropteridine diphosphokinase
VVPAFVGLGANLGDRRRTIEDAIDALRTLPHSRLVARSRLWSSPPHDATGPDYLNAAARVDTGLDPFELLAALQALERRFGRTRAYRNAPRTLDLDLLLSGDRTIDAPGLVVPHPRMVERAFVLRPLAEIAPNLVIPGRGPLGDWLARVRSQRCTPWEPRP